MEDNAAVQSPRRRQPADARAPWAIAASMAVMIGGALFLAFAMNQTAAPGRIQPAPASLTGEESPAPDMNAGAVESTPRPAAADTVSKESVADISEIEIAFGQPPRLNPERLAGRELTGELAPRIKPKLASDQNTSAAPRGSAANMVVRLADSWLADEFDQPPPFFFTSDLIADRAPQPPPAIAYQGDIAAPPHEIRISLTKGETFVDALKRANVRAQDRNAAAYAFGEHYNLRSLRPGQEFLLTVAEPNQTLYQLIASPEAPTVQLLSLEFRADAEHRIALSRTPDGAFNSEKSQAPLTSRLAAIEGRIDGSLYMSAKKQGAPDDVIAGLANMFAYDIDFQREIFGGDEFEAIFEVFYDDAGRMVGAGDILYARLKWRGRAKEKGYYRYASAENGGRADYFDAKGGSARRLLMKTPIDGARLSSGFGTRKHPILGYAKAHKGVDFAASRGTPIKAAGDGVIERAGPYGSFGNYIKIRHANNYKTAYAHLHAVKKGVRAGTRVRQGDIIGYVGSTGRSTGPHLHYEVHFKDKQVNPQNLKIATGIELKGADLVNFRNTRDRIDAMRTPHTDESTSLLAESKAKDKSL